MKPLGSEKLTGEDKIKRIIEIAQYKTNNVNESVSKTQYTKNAVDGNTYAIVKENDGYHVMVGLNESELDYVDGILNKNKYRFNSYAGALKKINLMLKPINETYNDGNEDPVLNEKKFVLKKPVESEPEMEAPVMDEPEMDAPAMDAPEMEDEGDMDFGGLGDDMDLDVDADLEDDMEVSDEESLGGEESEEGGDKLKTVQKLTGKLGQKLREMKIDLESSDIKYVLNSIISAIDLSKLSEEDLDDVMTNFEELENFEIEGDGEEGMEDFSGEEEPMTDDEDFISDEDLLGKEMEEPEGDLAELFNSVEEETNESDLDEGAFLKGLTSLGGKFVDYYKNNPEARKVVNSFAKNAVSKGTDMAAGELDKSDSVDKSGKISKALKGMNPSDDNIDALGKMIFGDLNEDDVNKKIDDVLGKYFLD